MTRDKARAKVVAEWLALHPGLRRTEAELVRFARAAAERTRFPSESHPETEIAAWLREATPAGGGNGQDAPGPTPAGR